MDFIIKRKTLIAMLFTGLSMLGYISYKNLPVELNPNATLPMLFVQVGTPLEVDPKYMENQAIIPLEGAIGTLEGIEEIVSSAGQQQGSIQISYQQGTNLKYAYLKLVEKVDEAKKQLPEDFRVQVFKFDLEQLNNMFMTIQVRGSGGVDRVRQVTNREIVEKIKNIDGVANAEVFGGREKSIEIILDRDVCEAYGISPSDVRSALSSNSRARTFAGRVTQNNQLHFVNVIAEFDDLNDIHNLVVKESGKVKLKDIAKIHFGLKPQETYSRVNGLESVTISLTKDSQANVIDLANRVKKAIEILNNDLGDKEIELVVQNNSAETMEDNINSIIDLALLGGLLAIFVLWIFLKNIRLVVAIALAIPISVYTAFNFFYAFGISINSLTLLGMALAIGMLLDNSIVVLENIYRLASQKIHPDRAVVQGTKEVWRSIFAATLTTITVFLPFVFSENFFIGLIGKHIGVSIISTLVISLVVALILIPSITHFFLKRGDKKPMRFETLSIHNRLIQIYLVLLKTTMRSPAKTVLGALGVFFAALLISLAVSITSSQEAEIKELKLYVTMPSGSTLDNTDVVVAEAEKKLEEIEEKKDLISQIYEEEAVITISLVDNYLDKRNYSVPKIKNEISKQLRDVSPASFSWDPPTTSRRFGGNEGGFENDDGFARMLGIGGQREKVIIRGQDFDRMLSHANDVKYYVGQLTSVKKIDIRLPAKRPELTLGLNKQLLAFYNIPVTSVLSELNSFQPNFSSGVTFKQDGEEYDIQIKTTGYNQQSERNLNDLKALPVRSADGAIYELQNISDFNFTEGLSTIRRTNQEKHLELVYEFTSEILDSKDLLNAARIEIDEIVASMPLPSGIALEVVHEENELGEFAFLLLMAFVLIYMILASVFESFTTPVVMMFSIPLAGIGSLAMLVLTGTSILNTNVMTGLLILLGIVVNNGIILIDYSRVLRARGYNESRALMMAGLARVRPILITAITTIIALIPLALGKAEYVALIGVPFAITIIGGLAISTLLTLIFIPTLNSGLKSALHWIYSQRTITKVIQIAVWVVGSYFIFTEVDSRIWQIINFILLVIAVPASIFFVQNSLRKANEKLIDKDEPLYIRIRNLVKIYEWDSRFMRDWKAGIGIRKRLGIETEYKSKQDLRRVIWQIPLVGFLIYFIYFHLHSAGWGLFLPIGLYIIVVSFLYPFQGFWNKTTEGSRMYLPFVLKGIFLVFLWLFPAFALMVYYFKYKNLGLVIPVGVFWYIAIAIKRTSESLYKNKVNINRITGRFKGLRKIFYRIVLSIPIIGKKKIPFKALKGVSLDIRTGMFGLLGPNGAGKSTLMRIICGVLEQSYGQITINGIDLREKREELQGLIGFLPQEFGMYENMTAWDFLNYMGILKKIYNQQERFDRINYVLSAVHMEANKHDKIGSFSGGMKQRVGIAQILLHLPRILVVDEPTAGLDPRERIRFRNLLVELSKERVVIFSTHIIEDVASSCNLVAVMKRGEVRYLGAPIEMAKIAKDRVWSLRLPVDKFDEIKDKLVVIHHLKEGDFIRCRCLAKDPPTDDAKLVKANLEDAYLYLLSDGE